MKIDEICFIVDKETLLLFNGTKFLPVPAKYSKHHYIASSLCISKIRSHGFKLPKNTSQDKIDIQSEMKMFDEAGLDAELDYSIASSVIELDDENDNYIETYAIEESKLDEEYDDIVKRTNHIDLIFPSYLSYSALYAFELLEKKNDIFIHFNENEAYAVIFKNGSYISTTKINSLEKIAQNTNVKIEDIRDMLANKGVQEDLYTPEEFIQMGNIQEELSKVVERISHSIGHKRGIFGLEHVDRIYLDFDGLDIPGFLELFSQYGYENAKKSNFDFFEEVESTQKHNALKALYALGYAQEKYTAPNLTIFPRKPNFLTTHAGQFSAILASSLLISVAFLSYESFSLQNLQEKNSQLTSDVSVMDTKTQKTQKSLLKVRKERKELKTKKTDAQSRLKSYVTLVDTLEDFESKTLQRQHMIKDIDMAMKKYSLSSKKFNYMDNDKVVIQIITKYDKRDTIAKFIKTLISKGYSHVQTSKVEKNESYYESFVEVQR